MYIGAQDFYRSDTSTAVTASNKQLTPFELDKKLESLKNADFPGYHRASFLVTYLDIFVKTASLSCGVSLFFTETSFSLGLVYDITIG